MQHLGTKELETDRLILRRFRLEDATSLFNNWTSDPEVTKFLSWQPHKNIGETIERLNSWIPQYDNLTAYRWAIVLKEINEPIGSISVHDDMDDRILRAEIGCCIGKKWWNHGISTEALSEVIRFLFTDVGVNTIAAMHDIHNPNSGKVMKKCGMKFEGILRKSMIDNQGLNDAACYSILKEWFRKGD